MAPQADIQTKYNRRRRRTARRRPFSTSTARKAIPAEKQQEVDRLFDAFDGSVAEAKRLERARERNSRSPR